MVAPVYRERQQTARVRWAYRRLRLAIEAILSRWPDSEAWVISALRNLADEMEGRR